MPLTAEQLLKKSSADLDELFGKSPPGDVPDGEASGTAMVCPGGVCGRVVAWLTRWFFWQGKVFIAGPKGLINRITIFSLKAIRAEVYPGKSRFDNKDCIVIDYSRTSLIAKLVRDEIRQVAPGLYLGQVFLGRSKTPLIKFCVSFQFQPERKCWRRLWASAALACLVALVYFLVRFNRDAPVTYANLEEHFKYGSTGGERASGIPLSMWRVLPELFPQYLPGKGLASVGFIFEEGRELPIGVSKRNVQGIDRVFFTCAVCHAGTVRDTPDSKPRIIAGMPANTVDLQAFERFLFACAQDENFTADRIVPEIAKAGGEDFLNRFLLKIVGLGMARDRFLMLRQRFSFMDREPDCGPGRVDTFNPPKVLLNFRMDNLPTNEWVGVCDLPSIWNQRKRQGMWLHWDGNNNSVQERDRSAAFGTGAFPPTLDRPSMKRIEDWILDATPPPYPYPIDPALAAKGRPIYAAYCARCHGASGGDFSGAEVGQVTPIEKIRTDRHRLDSYSPELCANQNLLYAAYPDERFKHFRKTFGYANQPLDGLWLRAPYLHNGSVPSLRVLLEPATNRPAVFYRGYDVYEPKRVGFVCDVPSEKGKKFFQYDTRQPGNGNFGHEGEEYGTTLGAGDKDALVEFLKTF